MEQLYRVESYETYDKKKFWRQKIKILIFFVVDLIVITVCVTSLSLVYERWRNCKHNFDAWAITIAAISFFSLILNFFQLYLNKKNEDMSKGADDTHGLGIVDSTPDRIKET